MLRNEPCTIALVRRGNEFYRHLALGPISYFTGPGSALRQKRGG